MVDVQLWTGLRRFTDGATVVTVDAATVGQMLDALVAKHPGLAPVIAAGGSVAIDGEITTGGRHLPLKPGSDVYLLQQMKGG